MVWDYMEYDWLKANKGPLYFLKEIIFNEILPNLFHKIKTYVNTNEDTWYKQRKTTKWISHNNK